MGFDRYNGKRLFDNTKHNNNATLANGALVDKVAGSCGMCARLLGGNIAIDGARFVGEVLQLHSYVPFLLFLSQGEKLKSWNYGVNVLHMLKRYFCKI